MRKLCGALFFLVFLIYCDPGQASPIDLGTLVRQGTATFFAAGGDQVLRLTDTSDPCPGPADPCATTTLAPAGAAWTPNPVPVANGFEFSFTFKMWDGQGQADPAGDPLGADGLAFVIQNSAAKNAALGIGAGGLGYMYIENSLAVEFDTFANAWWYGESGYGGGPAGHPTYPLDGNHISVQTRGTDFNVPNHYCDGFLRDFPGAPCPSDPSKVLVPVSRPLNALSNSDLPQTALITYLPGTLSMYLNSDPLPLFSIPMDLTTTLNLQNGSDAYIGFTAGTRWGYQNHDILAADFTPVPEPATWILLSGGLLVAALTSRKRNG